MKSILLENIRSKHYDNNIERYGEWSDTCICCGKRTVEKYLIQLTIDGLLVDVENEIEDSQGFFPIGNVCLKKFNNLSK